MLQNIKLLCKILKRSKSFIHDFVQRSMSRKEQNSKSEIKIIDLKKKDEAAIIFFRVFSFHVRLSNSKYTRKYLRQYEMNLDYRKNLSYTF